MDDDSCNARERRPAMEKHTKGMTTSQSDGTVSRGISDERESKALLERIKLTCMQSSWSERFCV